MNYARIGIYKFKPGLAKKSAEAARKGLLPLYRSLSGFVSFEDVANDEDQLVSVTRWLSREQAEAAVHKAAAWMRDNFADAVLSLENIIGDVLIDEKGQQAQQQGGGRALVQQIYDAFNAKDVERATALNLPDAKMVNMGFGMEQSMRDYFLNWAQAFPDARIEQVRISEGPDLVVAEFSGRGTHTGTLQTSMGPIAPTNRKVDARFCEIYEVRNGKIAGGRAYFDSLAFLQQLGLLPQFGAKGAQRPAAQPEQPGIH